jgi:hypothetical protein
LVIVDLILTAIEADIAVIPQLPCAFPHDRVNGGQSCPIQNLANLFPE